MTGPGIEPGTFGLVDECSTTELTLLLTSDLHTEYDEQLLEAIITLATCDGASVMVYLR